ncbi:hypothetical protein ACFV80_19670 [Streptomyces sp. NPDC059862]|uniref:hypothetical protein n=1 Tax=Streptomyces sp. NPDC059862 TaxID=3346975 RepID=UPI0036620B36
MGIGSRRASTGAATAALLLCFATAGTAAAEEVPADDTAASADETTDINERPGWEDDAPEEPIPEPGLRRCDGPSTWYNITSKKAYHIPSSWNGTRYKDGPGGTMTVSVTKSGTIAFEIGGSIEWSSNAIIAKAKAQVSTKITGTVGVTTGHTYTREISRNKYGNLQYGSWGYKVTWKKYKASGNGCDGVEIGHGTATLPTKATGWKYWETKS